MASQAQSTAPQAAAERPFKTRRLSDAIGAEIIGVDLSKPLDKATFDAIHDTWCANNIILFRDQDFSEESQIRFASYFGPLTKSTFNTMGKEEQSPLMLVSNIRKDGKPIGELPDGEMWFHTDQCYTEKPCSGTMLYAIEIPSHGGNTLFANMFTAYDTLPEAVKKRIAGLKAMNIYDYNLNKTMKTTTPSPDAQRYVHPIVRTHPVTGRKCLYVNRLMTTHIEGMPADESAALLNMLYDHQEQKQFIYEHVWRKGDVLLWDNRSTVHARTDFPTTERRLLRRIIVLGEKPF